MFASCCCYNKLSKIVWLKTMENSLTVLEIRSQKSFHQTDMKVLAGLIPSGGSRGESIFSPFSASRSHLYSMPDGP